MGPKRNSKANENQTEIDFSVKDPVLMSTKALQDEAKRLRVNIGSNMRRGYVEASQSASEQLSKVLTQLSTRDIVKKVKKVKTTRSSYAFLKKTMQEFFGRNPAPNHLEASMFVAAERRKWSGTPGLFVKCVSQFSGVSESTVYRFTYVGDHLTPETVAAISTTTLANNGMLALNNIAHLPRDMQHLPDAWAKVVKGWGPNGKHVKEYAPVPTDIQPLHRPTPVENTAKYLDEESTRVLGREDYNKIGRIIGAQSQGLYLKIKEVFSENHKSDLQTQVDVATTMNHILKELKTIREAFVALACRATNPPEEAVQSTSSSCEAATHGD